MTLLLFYLFLALVGIIGLVGSFLNVVIYYRLPIIMQRNYRKLTYLTIVLLVVVPTILLVFVVPVFAALFESFDADLPAFTKMVVSMSEWMQKNWWIVLGIILGVQYTFGYFKKRSPKFNHFLDRTLLKLPIVGIILNKSAIARFARTLSTMSAAGVPLVEALELVASACGNIIYAEAVMKIREEVSMGQRLQAAMAQVGLFQHMVQQMIAIDEEAGAMDAMLSKVADFYEEEVGNLVDNLNSLMMSIIMLVLGILVGSFIVAMYLPIFKLGETVS